MSVLDDIALVQDENLVVVDDGLQAVRDGDDGACQLADRLLDLAVGSVVDGGGGLVHDEHGRVLEHGAREAEELALALGQIVAGLGHGGGQVEEDVLVGGRRGCAIAVG